MGAIYKDGIWYGSESTGHSIRGNGQDMYPRDVLSFTGFDVRDDSVNAETDITAHKMTQSEWDAIFNAAPASTPLLGGGVNPTGTIISFMGIIVPAGYLKCDGSTYNISLYPYLAKHFEDNFGLTNYFGGDGTTTFKVPDLRGEFLRGTGLNSHVNSDIGLGEGNGAAVGEHQSATIVNAGFAYGGTTNNGKVSFRGNANSDGNLSLVQFVDSYIAADGSASFKQVMTTAGTVQNTPATAVQFGTIKPTNTSVLYCIKY